MGEVGGESGVVWSGGVGGEPAELTGGKRRAHPALTGSYGAHSTNGACQYSILNVVQAARLTPDRLLVLTRRLARLVSSMRTWRRRGLWCLSHLWSMSV